MIDYLLSNMWLFWIVIAVVSLILELSSGTFFIMCFAIGAVFSMIFSFFAIPFWIQVLVFALSSAACIFWVRPFALKYLHKGEDVRVSNAEALIGRVGRVSETIIAGGYGRVQIDGDDWKAQSKNGEEIEKSSKVKVLSMESIIITVENVD